MGFRIQAPKKTPRKEAETPMKSMFVVIACGPSARSPQGLQSYCKIYCEA